MKQIVQYADSVTMLEKMFARINKHYFNGDLIQPVITIQTDRSAYGHITVCDVWESQGERRKELNISPEYMKRDFVELLCTLEHEMCHIYNMQNGIKDVSNGNAYHNKKFKESAERIGLIIECVKTYGWTVTKPSDETRAYAIQLMRELKFDGFDIRRLGGLNVSGADQDQDQDQDQEPTKPKTNVGKKPTSTRKYICPCCGTTIRATKEVSVICADCNENFKLA